MKRLFNSTASPILGLSRPTKRIIALSIDVCLCILATWLAFYLRLDEFVNIDNELARPALLSIALALPIFAATGLYRAIFRYSGWPAIEAVGRAMTLYGLIYMTIVMAVGLDGTPRTIGGHPAIIIVLCRGWFETCGPTLVGGVYRTQLQKRLTAPMR